MAIVVDSPPRANHTQIHVHGFGVALVLVEVGDGLLTEQDAAAERRGYRNDHACTEFHPGLVPRSWHQLLILDGNLIRFDMSHLLGVLVQDDNGRGREAVQELDVEHLQLLESQVEGVLQLSLGVDRNDLEKTVVEMQADEPPLRIDVHDGPAVDHAPDSVCDVPHRLCEQLTAAAVVVQHAEFEALCQQAQRVPVGSWSADNLDVCDAAINRGIEDGLQAIGRQQVDDEPIALGDNQVLVPRPSEVCGKRELHR